MRTHIAWEGRGRLTKVPVIVTDTDNRLYKLVPLSLEGGANLTRAANLLLAAPDLLASAKDVVADLEHYVRTHGPGPDKRLAALLAAIARAEGRA